MMEPWEGRVLRDSAQSVELEECRGRDSRLPIEF